MAVPGFLIAFLYLLGGLCIMFGIVTAGLALAAPFMFRVNLLDARAYTLDHFGWLPGVTPENERLGGIVLALVLLVGGTSIAVLGTLMMALPGLA